jgi:hypothetical protein
MELFYKPLRKSTHLSLFTVYNFTFVWAILCLFGTKESIRRKLDRRGQIILWYW